MERSSVCRCYAPIWPYRSAPKIFTAVADTLEWCIASQGVNYVTHYLDDSVCSNGSTRLGSLFKELINTKSSMQRFKCPSGPRKIRRPFNRINFPVNITKLLLSVPNEKLAHLIDSLDHWIQRKTCTHRKLESLIGIL